jgi:hypothetical protein
LNRQQACFLIAQARPRHRKVRASERSRDSLYFDDGTPTPWRNGRGLQAQGKSAKSIAARSI